MEQLIMLTGILSALALLGAAYLLWKPLPHLERDVTAVSNGLRKNRHNIGE